MTMKGIGSKVLKGVIIAAGTAAGLVLANMFSGDEEEAVDTVEETEAEETEEKDDETGPIEPIEEE